MSCSGAATPSSSRRMAHASSAGTRTGAPPTSPTTPSRCPDVSLSVAGVEVQPGTRARGYLTGLRGVHPRRSPSPGSPSTASSPDPTLCVLGGVHSLESTPIEGLFRIIDELDPSTMMGRLIIVPFVNSTGFNARAPYDNPWDHLNQNRVWPGDPEGPLTKRVAHVVWTEFLEQGGRGSRRPLRRPR